ncbi:hypothetical protein C8R45DRAFT_1069823 [Mycena sanguinolenta]|nr:hypothetical protein C8R45DRAFT_1069823 [Mycena sanguinolenta]
MTCDWDVDAGKALPTALESPNTRRNRRRRRQMCHVMILFVLFDGFFPLSTTSSVASTPDYLGYRFPGPQHVSQACSLYLSSSARALLALFGNSLASKNNDRLVAHAASSTNQIPKLVNGGPITFPLDDPCCLFGIFQYCGGYLLWVYRMWKITVAATAGVTSSIPRHHLVQNGLRFVSSVMQRDSVATGINACGSTRSWFDIIMARFGRQEYINFPGANLDIRYVSLDVCGDCASFGTGNTQSLAETAVDGARRPGYINDIVLCILERLRTHPHVLYIDVNIHHNDSGEAFYTTDRVIEFFPRTGGQDDRVRGKRNGYSLNVPLDNGITDTASLSLS